MRKVGSTIFEVRWILALVVALVIALSWSAAAHAQTPADDAYGSPLSSAGSSESGVASEGYEGGAADSGSVEAADEGPAVGVLPDTGGASLILGSAIALMLVGTGTLAIRRVYRR